MSERGPEHRRDALTGADVWIAAGRQERPAAPAAAGCPFCPGGLEAPDEEPYDVRSFVNRWPSMPEDRCEVILYSPRHDAAFWQLGAEGVARVVALWASRTAALGRRADVAYVLPFENRGAEVGATIEHPHGQVYAFDAIPPAARRELDAVVCALCDEREARPDLVVSSDNDDVVRAVVPHAAAWPFELLVAPVAHVPDMVDLVDRKPLRRAFAGVLVDALQRLDALFDAPMPYMLWVHQRPTDGGAWPTAHVHVHVAPLLRGAATARYVAAGELGSGVFFNPIAPEDAARRLRQLLR